MSAEPLHTAAEWIKSSYSDGDGGQCVEVSRGLLPHGVVPVRDSKRRHGPQLTLPAAEGAAFVGALRGGGLTA
ncbi:MULTISPECIES: DUF397 domain-containing protein [Streptomyces]|uniref:DUF397 domain-containing protein n=1 Tax=Streptomyces TaxID=1883 RepID=UPI0022497959|nr:DUF397 domain-containing protein [Streptomyces sp. JHD 1]MCX2968897.1 DUF397 domain-containing protein [Streptomyces sp. JHD 1]